MKHITTLLTLALVAFIATPAHAQTRTINTRPSEAITERIQEKSLDREEIKEKRNDEMREKYDSAGARIQKQLAFIFEKIQRTHDRIELRAQTMSDRGMDIGNAKELLIQSQTALDLAKTQSDKLAEFFADQTQPADLDEARTLIKEIKTNIRMSHDLLQKSLAELKRSFVSQREDKKEDREQNKERDQNMLQKPNSSEMEIEAEIFTDITVVKVERGDKKDWYKFQTRDRAQIVANLAQELAMSEERILSIIKFELEDRESRADDLN